MLSRFDRRTLLAGGAAAAAGFAGSLSINMARNADPTIEKALLAGRSNTEPSVREAAYKTVNKRLALDLPTCGWTVRCGPLSATPLCRTSTTRPRHRASPRSG